MVLKHDKKSLVLIVNTKKDDRLPSFFRILSCIKIVEYFFDIFHSLTLNTFVYLKSTIDLIGYLCCE